MSRARALLAVGQRLAVAVAGKGSAVPAWRAAASLAAFSTQQPTAYVAPSNDVPGMTGE